MLKNIINVQNLSKSFEISSKEPGLKGTIKHFFRRKTKSLKVIKDISFEIKGEIVGFLGANGAGKTTILNALWLNLSKRRFNISFRLLAVQKKREFLKEYHFNNGSKTTTYLGSSSN